MGASCRSSSEKAVNHEHPKHHPAPGPTRSLPRTAERRTALVIHLTSIGQPDQIIEVRGTGRPIFGDDPGQGAERLKGWK